MWNRMLPIVSPHFMVLLSEVSDSAVIQSFLNSLYYLFESRTLKFAKTSWDFKAYLCHPKKTHKNFKPYTSARNVWYFYNDLEWYLPKFYNNNSSYIIYSVIYPSVYLSRTSNIIMKAEGWIIFIGREFGEAN